ncbi:MAG: cysteine dioxygenase family protein [Planctomycetota bacterium]
MSKVQSVDDFITDLCRLEASLITKDRLVEFLQERTIKSTGLDRFSTFIDERYTRNLIYRDDLFEVIMLCWKPGQGTPVHTHNGQLGWMVMDCGALEVQNYKWTGCNKPENQNVVGIDCLGGATQINVEPTEVAMCHPGGSVATVDKIQTIHSIACPPAARSARAASTSTRGRSTSCISFDLRARRAPHAQVRHDPRRRAGRGGHRPVRRARGTRQRLSRAAITRRARTCPAADPSARRGTRAPCCASPRTPRREHLHREQRLGRSPAARRWCASRTGSSPRSARSARAARQARGCGSPVLARRSVPCTMTTPSWVSAKCWVVVAISS